MACYFETPGNAKHPSN